MSGKYKLGGKRFGKLTVIKEYGRDKKGQVTWLCQCECGNSAIVNGTDLVRGNNQSCGCLHGENHGHADDRLYNVWRTMKARCQNENNEKYPAYGGRGVSICEEWDRSFTAFMNWAIENGYDYEAKYGDCTLDRIDVNGNYCPENCRWVDMATQARNRRPAPKHTRGIEVEYKGKRYISLSELADEYGFHSMKIYRRIHRMTVEEAMEEILSGSTGR